MSLPQNARQIARQKVRADLLDKGLTLKDFALREGFTPVMVGWTFRRYVGTKDTPPRGEIARAILSKLEEYVGPELLKGKSCHETPPGDEDEENLCAGKACERSGPIRRGLLGGKETL